ncbi:hypothetical protein WKK05_22670 [Nostoc sp. UHCC 0302]|uniref:hypothetical protein n=1 Tax=Nostoc sp. UHCC 0302 TaxID=3134896 RepID=UPI00311CCCF3
MNNLRLFPVVSKSMIHDSQKNQLTDLLEWCRIVYGCLDAGQVDDAKIFLEQAITEAEKPRKD